MHSRLATAVRLVRGRTASRGRSRTRLVLAGVVFFLHLAAVAEAQEVAPRHLLDGRLYEPQPAETGALVIAPQVRLEAVTVDELSYGRGTGPIDLGRWRGPGSTVDLPPIRLEVRRQVPTLWRLRLADQTGLADLDVRVELVAINGHRDRLSHLERPRAEIAANVEPLAPVVVDRDATSVVIEGGLDLTLGLDETRFAGNYAGTLTVTINRF